MSSSFIFKLSARLGLQFEFILVTLPQTLSTLTNFSNTFMSNFLWSVFSAKKKDIVHVNVPQTLTAWNVPPVFPSHLDTVDAQHLQNRAVPGVQLAEGGHAARVRQLVYPGKLKTKITMVALKRHHLYQIMCAYVCDVVNFFANYGRVRMRTTTMCDVVSSFAYFVTWWDDVIVADNLLVTWGVRGAVAGK